MAIDKLGSAQALIAALRAEVGQRKGRVQGRAELHAERPPAHGPSRDMEVLRKQLAEIVKAVDTRDADAVRKVRPQMVRAILLWEFGPELREHPEWQAMLETITNTLEARGADGGAGFVKLIDSLKR